MSLEEMTKIDNLKSWTSGVEVDWDTVKQLRNIAELPILAGHVAVMPDVHLGKGATVGSVIPTKGAIIPAAVGVDIGCGMTAVRTELSANELPDSLGGLRLRIERRVPVGFSSHDTPLNPLREGLWGVALSNAGKKLAQRYDSLKILEVIGKHDHKRTFNQLGTLGGGNHFIELCLDESNGVWVMLHSGSRNIGKTIGEAAIHMSRQIAAHFRSFWADQLVLTLRCTRRVRNRLGLPERLPDAPRSSGVLGDWYVHLVRFGRSEFAIATSERSLLTM